MPVAQASWVSSGCLRERETEGNAARWTTWVVAAAARDAHRREAPRPLPRGVDVLLVQISGDLGDDGVGVRVERRAHLAAVLRARLALVPQRVVGHGAAVHRRARTDDAHVRDEEEARGAARTLALPGEDGRKPLELRAPHRVVDLRRRPVVGV